jgi:hypothetical protein
MAVIRSASLGWTAGQNVTTQIATLVPTLKPFDELVLEHKYELTGGPYQFPDDFTMSAVQGGGFDISDTASAGAISVFKLGHRNVIRNVTISSPSAPTRLPDSLEAVAGIDFHTRRIIQSDAKDDCVIEHCRLENNIAHHLLFNGGNRCVIRHNHISGGFWQIMMYGACLDFHYAYNFIEKSVGEGIKTGVGNATPPHGTQRTLVEHCIFQGARRDGIDTTGGFKDGIIRDCIFRRNDPGGVGGGVDIKTYYDPPMVPQPNIINTGIVIERCRFIDTRNAIVLSLVDRVPVLTTQELCRAYAPHDLRVVDCEFERTIDWPYEVRAFLFKGAHSVEWRNLRRVGTVTLQGTGIIVGSAVAQQPGVLNYGFGGTELASGTPRGFDDSVYFIYGPQGKTDPTDPGDPPPPTADPIMWIDPDGIFKIDTDRTGTLQKPVTVRAVNAFGEARATFTVRVA